MHRARIRSGELLTGDTVSAEVDRSRRQAVSRAHTATHLVHRAFRLALGETATQAGSLNAPGRLRFDFHSPPAVPASVVRDVEEEINEVLLRDLPVSAFVTSLDEARKLGAMALFGEKYGNSVRVVDVGEREHPYARELCGGTHVTRSAQLGAVTLLSESSVAAGTRRVEGLVGLDAFKYLSRERLLLSQVSAAVKATRPEEVPERVNDIVLRLRDAERQLDKLRADAVLAGAAALVESASDIGGVALVAAQAPDGTGAKRRTHAGDRRPWPFRRPTGRRRRRGCDRRQGAAGGGDHPRRPRARTVCSHAVRHRGAGHHRRRRGGRDDLAQGSGADADALPRAFGAIEAAVARQPLRSGPVSARRADRSRRGQRPRRSCRERPGCAGWLFR